MKQYGMQQEAKQYLSMLRFLNESTDDYLFVWDFKTGSIYFTKDINERFPIGPQKKQGYQTRDWESIVYPKDLPEVQKDFARLVKGEAVTHDMEYRLIDRSGRRVWISCRGKSIVGEDGRPVMMVGRVSDQVLQKSDPMSSLWNAGQFEEDLKAVLSEGICGYLMVMCLDDLKNVNIIYGREHGDQMVLDMTASLEEMVEMPDSVYRVSGNRFAVNLIGKSKKYVEVFYEALKDRMRSLCTFSAGAVEYSPEKKLSAVEIYQYAEAAMDRAKKQGDILEFFSLQDYEERLSYLELQDEIQHSAENGFAGFSLCYQPQIDMNSYQITGAEALLRYDSPIKQERISPIYVIPILERTGLICQVGLWVLQTALQRCKEWRRHIPDFNISVNLSYVQLKQEGIGELVLECLKETGLPGSALTLELTETMELEEYSYFNRIFYQWAKMGIQISLDDFGTGYSNLSYLKSIDIHELKIDRSLVSRIQYSAYNYRLLSNLIELAHSAQIRVCCEGVETEGELLALQKLHPDTLQGYLFAAPYNQETFEKLYINSENPEYQKRRKEEEHYRQIDQNANVKETAQMDDEDPGIIAENIEELIYVSNPGSYELYYLNPAGRSLSGIYDYKGKPCYQVLYGKKQPCEFCNNEKLKQDRFLTREIKNEYHSRRFLVKDKLIPWKGKLSRLEIAYDITDQEPEPSKYPDKLEAEQNREDIFKNRYNANLPEVRYEDILEVMELGLWEIRIDKENAQYEMFADNTMCRLLGLQKKLAPQECYLHWYNRINDGYYQYVNQAVEEMISLNKIVQIEYTWSHPIHGEVMVRCVGSRVENSDGKICLQGYHRIISDINRVKFLPDAVIGEAFEYNEQKRTIYFHTSRNLLVGNEEREEDFPECWIKRDIVHPHFAEEFCRIFDEISEEQEISGQEIPFKVKSGTYEWFRIRAHHLSSGKKDGHLIVVLLEPVGDERSKELEFARISDFYNAILSETIAYAEVDVESGELMKSDGLWTNYEAEAHQLGIPFTELMKRHMKEAVYPEDVETYQGYLNLENIKKMYHSKEVTKKWSFRRKTKDEVHWVELVVHVFKEKFTDNIYALLYLKDIDSEKRQQLANEAEASRDPLTNVYNRRAFERKVVQYMAETDGAKGTLLLLDVDNFKDINDKYGHLAGDAVLQQLSAILTGIFRKRDIVGRWGGDEFLVFLSNISDKDVLTRRMNEMYMCLQRKCRVPITCSIGITFVKAAGFSYIESLREADAALYISKGNGKKQYHYYGEE